MKSIGKIFTFFYPLFMLGMILTANFRPSYLLIFVFALSIGIDLFILWDKYAFSKEENHDRYWGKSKNIMIAIFIAMVILFFVTDQFCGSHIVLINGYGETHNSAEAKKKTHHRLEKKSEHVTSEEATTPVETTVMAMEQFTQKATSLDKNTELNNKTHSYEDAYDEGYEDIYENEDYDDERYMRDRDYANGVDDAMDDAEEDFGDDW